MKQLALNPTIAMRDGHQHVISCASCGAVLVYAGKRDLGPCSACARDDWKKARLPLAGLVEVES